MATYRNSWPAPFLGGLDPEQNQTNATNQILFLYQMITPMVARLVREPFDREGWFFELKWDGFRAIAETDGRDGVKLYSRRHNDFKKRFPPIADALAELKQPAILDGEIVALDEEGKPRFEWLVNRGPQKGILVYYVFDLLKLGDVDLRAKPLHRRKKLLEKLLKGNPRLLYVEHMEREGLAMFAGDPNSWLGGHRRQRFKKLVCGRASNHMALAEGEESGVSAQRESGVQAKQTVSWAS